MIYLNVYKEKINQFWNGVYRYKKKIMTTTLMLLFPYCFIGAKAE